MIVRLHRLHLTGIGMLFLVLALAACGGSSPTATPVAPTKAPAAAGAGIPNSFSGAVPGTDAFIALTTNGATSLSYICDSKQVSTWFNGPVTGNAIDITAANGNHLKATLAATGATGTVTMGGKDFPFTAPSSGGNGGLFRAEQSVNGGNVVGGWIVSADGQQRGAVGQAKEGKEEITPAPQLVVAQRSSAGTWAMTHPTFGPLTAKRVVEPDDHRG